MNLDQLIKAVEAATVEKEVLVRSKDFYARRGDWDEETIRYIDADRFMEALRLTHIG